MNSQRSPYEPRLGETFLEDFRRGDLRRTISRDYRDLKQFMLTEERQKKLRSMKRVKRILYVSWWMFKSLLLKLTPARRILLAVALLLLVVQDNFTINGSQFRVDFNFNAFSFLILLFILMLELKDKLIAQQELEAGQAIQKALTPQRSPDVPGWRLWLFTRSANEVGGDLIDCMKINDTRFGVAVGDVAGKGLRAALLTAKLQATLRAFVSDSSSLSELARKMNQIFSRDSLPNLFASLLYVELTSDDGKLRLFNAGHIPPVVVRTSEVEKLTKGDAALGLMPEAKFEEHSLTLERGEFLLSYSDGVTEAQSEAGEFFGEQRLLDLLPQLRHFSTDQTGETIVAELDRFIGEARANDDVTIAILRRV